MSAVLVVQDEAVTVNPGPREGGPRRRRAFTAREKLDHLTAYEAACEFEPINEGTRFTHVEQGVFLDQFWADGPNREEGSWGLLDALGNHLA